MPQFEPKHLGIKKSVPEHPEYTILDSFDAPGVVTVTFKTKEFTSLCPVTGQPDFVDVQITYRPDKKCLESKSVKLYLQSFRNEHSFMETLSCRIFDDIMLAVQPLWLNVTVQSTPRGGIGLVSSRETGMEDISKELKRIKEK